MSDRHFDGPSSHGVFAQGDRALLIDSKGRRYLVTLEVGGSFQTHAGVLSFDELIGGPSGCLVTARQGDGGSGSGRRFIAVRPTLADVILKMPRGAQVIYPKDLGAMLLAADLFPGARILEAGVGSGALSMVALRAGCSIVGYEIRDDFAARAKKNVSALLGDDVDYEVVHRDVYEGISERGLDRILLDLPEPWRVVAHAERALVAGGILCAYLPGINQTAELRSRLDHSSFALAETTEILERTWHIEGRSVRPDHRMVGHTGFLTTARLVVGNRIQRLGNDALATEEDGWHERRDLLEEESSGDPQADDHRS